MAIDTNKNEDNEEYDCSYYVIYEHTYKPK